MNIQKKSLQRVSDLLGSVNLYNTYHALTTSLDACNLDADTKRAIIGEYSKYQSAMTSEKKIINEAKSWVDSILEDLK